MQPKILGLVGILHLPETQSFRLKQIGGRLWQGQSFIPAATALEFCCLTAQLRRQSSLFTVGGSVSIPQEKSTSGIVLSRAGGFLGPPKGARKPLNFNDTGKILCKCADLWRKISTASHKRCEACFIADKLCSVCAFKLIFIGHEKK